MDMKLAPVHPGEVLLEDFMKPLGLSAYRVAKDIGVEPIRISRIIHRKRAVTAETALLFGKYFGTSPEVWIRLQAQYDLETADPAAREKANAVRPLVAEVLKRKLTNRTRVTDIVEMLDGRNVKLSRTPKTRLAPKAAVKGRDLGGHAVSR
jgi:addiction module HigA family antidote